MNKLVSVLIPCYNHEKYVKETIQSIINQTYENIELIVIDDGSKDLSWQKIQEMKDVCEKRFKKVHFETKQNEGMCATLNKLLSYANGEFVLIIASDDIAKENLIKKEVEFLTTNTDYAVCCGNNEIIDSNSKHCYWDKDRNIVYDEDKATYKTFVDFIKNERKDVDFNSENIISYDKLVFGNYVPNGYVIRKSIYEKIGKYPIEAPLEDWWFYMQVAKYSKVKYIDEVLFSYRWHESNTIKNAEKITKMIQKNLFYESKNLVTLNPNACLPYIKKYTKSGIIYRKKGKEFLLEKIYSYKDGKKIKQVKLFGIKIYEKIIGNMEGNI